MDPSLRWRRAIGQEATSRSGSARSTPGSGNAATASSQRLGPGPSLGLLKSGEAAFRSRDGVERKALWARDQPRKKKHNRRDSVYTDQRSESFEGGPATKLYVKCTISEDRTDSRRNQSDRLCALGKRKRRWRRKCSSEAQFGVDTQEDNALPEISSDHDIYQDLSTDGESNELRPPSEPRKSRRSSTSAVPNRDYVLGLADPSRSSTTTSGPEPSAKRTQKHPATFQCSLCPKRFTRAYNLRSHLRTHSDERPFICSVCGKAFARQHDRKRHEGLHSGEKKFVCKGDTKDGSTWGCGRRFARADALGRHFRSEAGRVCIQKLLIEEKLERMSMFDENGGTLMGQSLMSQPMGLNSYSNVSRRAEEWTNGPTSNPYPLPSVLFKQYPTLEGIWHGLSASDPDYSELD